MIVSYNEIQNLCRKAFCGAGFETGDAEDAAEMVAWMQCHGLGGLAALHRGLNFLLQEDPDRLPEIVYQDCDLAILDGHGQSVLRCGSLAAELCFAKARARGLAVVKIRRCHNRQLIMGYLARVASRGMNVTAFWRNAQYPLNEQVVGFRAGKSVPEIRVYAVRDVPEENAPNDGITLIMANHVDLLPSMRSDYQYELLASHDESSLTAFQDAAFAQGIEVDESRWGELKRLASRILVEATEASRQGAGAGQRDND